MEKQELYLKTMFCCMACDGTIAQEEVDSIRRIVAASGVLETVNIEEVLNRYITAMNKNGALFLQRFLNELVETQLTTEEALQIIDWSLKTIEADNAIEYSEVKFFKKIRARLSLTDEQILVQHPDKEDFLLPDIDAWGEPVWDEHIQFANIQIA